MTTYYLLAFTISWIGWIPTLAASHRIHFFTHPFWTVFLILPAVGPALAARLVTIWQGSDYAPKPVRALLAWGVAWYWYAAAITLPLLVVWTTGVLSSWFPQQISSVPLKNNNFIVYLLLSILANPWEEVGWRGFALIRLQRRYPPLMATFIVGTMWGLWHLPIFFLSQGPISMAAIPFWPWFTALLGQSLVMSWLFNRAAGSLIIVSLYHIAMNSFGALIGVRSYWALALVEVSLATALWLLSGSGLAANLPESEKRISPGNRSG